MCFGSNFNMSKFRSKSRLALSCMARQYICVNTLVMLAQTRFSSCDDALQQQAHAARCLNAWDKSGAHHGV